MTDSVLASVPLAPRDPILGLTEAFNADPNPRRVNLGVGVYCDETGKIPLLECVKRAERLALDGTPARGYLPIDGIPTYDRAVKSLVFGERAAKAPERIVTVQSLGGTGGLKVGADFLRRILPEAQVWISDPSWENHRALYEAAGFQVNAYPYYDPGTHGLRFDAMMACLRGLAAGSIVVLHTCCHNPTGVDLTPAQWRDVAECVVSRQLVPVLDFAYQGFGAGLDEDGFPIHLFTATGLPVFVANSFSKSFSLYGERVGGLSVVTASAEEASRVLSQLKRLIRSNYSNPPTHGAQIVATVLSTPELRALWEQELGGMRTRIAAMRERFVQLMAERIPDRDFSFIRAQRGMFSYSGLTVTQVRALRERFSVYAIESGRICVAALNSHNIEYACDAVAAVLRDHAAPSAAAGGIATAAASAP